MDDGVRFPVLRRGMAMLGLLVVCAMGESCRTSSGAEGSQPESASANLVGSLSGLYYPGYIRAFGRAENECPETSQKEYCWAEVARNAGQDSHQYGLKVGFRLKGETDAPYILLNLETGEFFDSGKSLSLKPPKDGGSYYQYLDGLQDMIDILGKSKTVFPLQYVAGVMDAVKQMTEVDGIKVQLWVGFLVRGEDNKVIIDYKAKAPREIVLQFCNAHKPVTEKRFAVDAGGAQRIEVIHIPQKVDDAPPQYIRVFLVAPRDPTSKALASDGFGRAMN